MQIINKGSTNLADTVKANDQILVRFSEYSLMDKVVTVSNLDYAEVVDEFNYRVTSSSIAGQFTQGFMLSYYGTSVPAGWLVPLAYVRDGACVKLIVPSKWDIARLCNLYTLIITIFRNIKSINNYSITNNL